MAPAPQLELPIACVPGRTCFIQQYPDHDPGPGARDYRCGQRVYDGHDGVDIRLPSIASQRKGVAVLVAAPGVVRGVRDDMNDVVLDRSNLASIKGRECGNGVVIAHPGGWETQYCHMARGSISVKPGQSVQPGEKLGMVGLSGDTQFPHVHLSVRHESTKVDPFAPALSPGTCGAGGGKMLWTAKAAAVLAYRETEIINAGFAAGPVSMDTIDQGSTEKPTASSSALVFYARAIGLQPGDLVRLKVNQPDGTELVRSDTPVDRAKAQWLSFAGKKRPVSGWPRGQYRAECSILRAGKIAATITGTLQL